MRLLDSYLLRQLPLPFIVGLGTFVCIMLAEVAWRASGVLFGPGISGITVIKFLLYSTPRLIVWSTPVGMVVAVSMAMVSLERAGEITAMRVGGASLLRIQLPWILVSVVLAGAAVWMNQAVVPYTTRRAYQLFQQLTYQAPVAREAWNELFRSPTGELFFVRRMNAASGTLEGITIWRRDRNGVVRRIVVAKRARVVGRQWVLEEGYVREFDAVGAPLGGPKRFDKLPIDMWAAIHHYYSERRTPYEMSISELGELARVLQAGGRDPHKLLVHLHFKY